MSKPRILFFANVATTLGMGLAIVGYGVAKLPGFVLGMAGAQLLALAIVNNNLPCRRGEAWKQTLALTALFATFAGLAVTALHVAPWTAAWQRLLLAGAFAGAPAALAGLDVIRVMRRESEP